MTKTRVGIVGVGPSAVTHLNFSLSYRGVTVVGVVDSDERALKAFGERNRINGCYNSLAQFIESRSPDVVHVLVPLKERFALCAEALSLGVNVIVESPMALNSKEAEELYRVAEENGLMLSTVHPSIFTEPMATLAELIETGAMGPVHSAEVHYSIDTRTEDFSDYPAPNVLPWPFELPGSIYQNFLPEPLFTLLEYIGTPIEIEVMSDSNGALPQEMADEVSVLVKGTRALGTLTLSFAPTEPVQRLRVYGTKMRAEADIVADRLITERTGSEALRVRKRDYNIKSALNIIGSSAKSLYSSLRDKREPLYGVKTLIHSFYEALKSSAEAPVSKASALAVLDATEEIYKKLDITELKFNHILPSETNFPLMHKEKVLVTGGTGFFGRVLVRRLVKEGYEVRVLARKLSDISVLDEHKIEIFYGDTADAASLGAAFDGVDVVIHAGISKRPRESHTSNVIGTEKVVEAAKTSYIDKLIYLGSCSVYGVSDAPGGLVTEESALEPLASKHGEVCETLQKADSIVLDAIDDGLCAVLLRTARVYGPGAESYTPEYTLRTGANYLSLDNGRFHPQFVHVENLADAVLRALQSESADREVLNVVDYEPITTRQYMNRLIRNVNPNARAFYVPYPLSRAAITTIDRVTRALGFRPLYNRYALESTLSGTVYDSSKIRKVLGWKQRIGFDTAAGEILEYEQVRY
ncbi:MAG: NAD-dependent epimerase/dehydratase family protein [Proteobacteria bacterium]|nr:NAD-dependent epimerase/dehydratase family protein [Pseudomonadota bacterium]